MVSLAATLEKHPVALSLTMARTRHYPIAPLSNFVALYLRGGNNK
jgi:hypothetical protein